MTYKVYVLDIGRKFLYLQWLDPLTQRKQTRSSKCTRRRDAERKAKELEDRLNEHHSPADGSLSWSKFLEHFEHQHLIGLREKSGKKLSSVLQRYEREMRPAKIGDVTTASVSMFAAAMRKAGLADATITSNLGALKAAVAWGHRMGCIPFMPKFPRAATQTSGAGRGRPLRLPEIVRMLRVVPTVVGDAAKPGWRHIIKGLWLSGLRLGEAMELRWTPGPHPFVVIGETSGVLVVPGASDKTGKDRKVPLAPDMLRLLQRTPPADRDGFVFNPLGDRSRRVRYYRVSQTIAAIGKAAAVIVDHANERTATAHDLRRSFAQRWAPRLSAVDLQRVMRHASIQTTLGYYLDADTEALSQRMASASANTGRRH